MTGPIERRSFGRTAASKGVLLFFSTQRGVFTGEVCDVTHVGAKVKLNGLNLLPSNFNLIRVVVKVKISLSINLSRLVEPGPAMEIANN